MKRYRVRIILLLAALIIINLAYVAAKDGFIHKVIAQKLKAYCEKKYAAQIVYGSVSGNLLTNFSLRDVRIEDIKEKSYFLRVKVRFKQNQGHGKDQGPYNDP